MMKRIGLMSLVAMLFVAGMIGCAAEPLEKVYSETPTEKSELAYLVTRFERTNNRNAEGNYNVEELGMDPIAGYIYTYGAPTNPVADIEPFAALDDRCNVCTEELAELYDVTCCGGQMLEMGICQAGTFFPAKPAKCDVTSGIKVPGISLPEEIRSAMSFQMRGVTAGDGVGFGVYFSDDTDPATEFGKEPRSLGEMGQKGISFWARGNATLVVSLNMPQVIPLSDGGDCDDGAGEKCFDYHKVKFELDGTWREYWAQWNEFKQEGWGIQVPLDPNRFINIQFVVEPPASGGKSFEAWLDSIGFYGGDIWPHTEFMNDTDVEVDTVPEDTTPADSDSAVDTTPDPVDTEEDTEDTGDTVPEDTGDTEDTDDTDQ